MSIATLNGNLLYVAKQYPVEWKSPDGDGVSDVKFNEVKDIWLATPDSFISPDRSPVELFPNVNHIKVENASNSTDLNDMFGGLDSLSGVEILGAQNIKEMKYTFETCRSLTNLYIDNLSSCTAADNCFEGAHIGGYFNFATFSAVKNAGGMFNSTQFLNDWIRSSVDLNSMAALEDAQYMFVASNIQNVNMNQLHNLADTSYMFMDCTSFTGNIIPIIDAMYANGCPCTATSDKHYAMFARCENAADWNAAKRKYPEWCP